MKILVALSRFPWPISKGDRLRAFEQIKGLSARHEIHLVCLNDTPVSEEDKAKLAPYCKSIRVIHQGKFKRMSNLLKGIFSSVPFQVHYFKNPEAKSAIEATIRQEKIDIVYVQLLRMGQNLPATQVPMFLDFMDCFSMGMRNRVPHSWFWERPAIAIEASRLRTYEEKIISKFRAWSVISPSDANELPGVAGKKAIVIPNGVNPDFFSRKPAAERDIDIIFTGNMAYPPNVQAAHNLVYRILPQLKLRGLNPMLCIAGANPTEDVKRLASNRVMVTGFVPDLRDYMARSKTCIAPMNSGSGLQNKLLEVMAMGLPVFTTELANKALGAIDEKEVIVCKDHVDFGRKYTQYVMHPSKLAEIARNGQALVREKFNWEKNNLALEKALEEVLKG